MAGVAGLAYLVRYRGPTYGILLTLGLVTQATSRVRLGTIMTPLPARHASREAPAE